MPLESGAEPYLRAEECGALMEKPGTRLGSVCIEVRAGPQQAGQISSRLRPEY